MSTATVENKLPDTTAPAEQADTSQNIVGLTAKAAEKVKEIRGEENIEDTYSSG
jgi:hypothetical protein